MIIAGCSEQACENILEDDQFLDLNSDGVNDVRYEFTDNGYYELTDSNFDGEIDTSSFYDNSGRILNSQIDQNHDGFLETETLYENGTATKSFTDLNKDGELDLLFIYDIGALTCAAKYYHDEGNVYLGSYRFSFDYPQGSERIQKLSEEQLLQSRKMLLIEVCNPH